MSGFHKVDVHHHIVPPQIAGSNDGMHGMHAPDWDWETDSSFCKDVGIGTRIFSVSTPGVFNIEDPDKAASTARSMNEYALSYKKKHPDACGYFATIPSPVFTKQALQELRYAFDHLDADGVTLFTSYTKHNNYLGHEDFVPLWEELNSRSAVVFVHPCDNGSVNAIPWNDKVCGPAFDWPHETGRTAMDMIVNGRMRQFPNVKIILSHGGGTLPALISRACMISMPEFGGVMSAGELREDAQKFYLDTALSGSDETFPMILKFAKRGHLLFGSDYPHAFYRQSKAHSDYIDAFSIPEEVRKDVYYGAAMALFPRLKEAFQNL